MVNGGREIVGSGGDTVTLTQVRAMVIIASRGPLHPAALADAMLVHPSNATRTCGLLSPPGG